MKSFKWLIAALVMVPSMLFAKNEIAFLDTYDQLSAHRAEAGHWLVRDAANISKGGQGGDPAVQKGWAMYTWDFTYSRWIRICEEQSLSSTWDERLLKTYTKLSVHSNDLAKVKNDLIAAINQDRANINALSTKVTKNTNDIAANKTRIETVDSTAKTRDDRVLALAKEYTDEKTKGGGVDTNAVKQIAGELDNVVKTEVKAYADEKVDESNTEIKDIIYSKSVAFGEGVTNGESRTRTVIINPDGRYPSTVGNYGYNVAIGIDHEVGTKENGRYAVAIGTSSKALAMHSYAWGSQINALVNNTTVMGYGLSATNEWSTVVGHGIRPTGMRFDTYEAMVAWLSNSANRDKLYVDMGFLISDGPGSTYGITDVYMVPDPETGMYCKLEKNPLDYKMGGHMWQYGKTHGRGTFNIVAIGDGVNDYGLANVYINDHSLAELTGVRKGEPVWKPVYNKGLWEDPVLCAHDMTVAIGVNAMATETASSCQAIAIGRDSLSAGSATVAVGPNSFAIGPQAVALGWRANAVGSHAIAIGAAKKSGENYYKDGSINPNSDLCVAEGAESIAIGFNAKSKANKSIAIGDNAQATAEGAAQIGTGVNSTPNTLKFQNITLVADGKIVGTFDPKELDPKKAPVIDRGGDELVVTAMPHVVNTLMASKPADPGSEVAIEPAGSRNYDIFIPNTAEFRAGFPISLESEVSGAESIFVGDKKQCYTLPVMVKVQQPHESVVLFTVTELKDKTDWTPVITNMCLQCVDEPAGVKFKTIGDHALEGVSLHAATEFKIVYPTDSTLTTAVTNDLEVAEAGKLIQGTFYNYTSKVDYTPSPAMGFKSVGLKLNSWYEIIYKTVNGEAQVKRYDVSFDL